MLFLRAVFISLVLCSFVVASAECLSQKLKPQRLEITDYKWTSEQWTSDDRPYVKLRSNIDASIARIKSNQKQLAAMVNHYKKVAQRKPLDPLSQFGWAYAMFESSRVQYSGDQRWYEPRAVSLAMAKPLSPRSYQYDRLRFVVTNLWFNLPKLKPLGFRLMRRNPNDLAVKFQMARLLAAQSTTLAEKQQSVRYAEEYARVRPNTLQAYSILNLTYWLLFNLSQNVSDLDKAIEAGQKALNLLPSNSQRRAEAEALVRQIQRQKQRHLEKVGKS